MGAGENRTPGRRHTVPGAFGRLTPCRGAHWALCLAFVPAFAAPDKSPGSPGDAATSPPLSRPTPPSAPGPARLALWVDLSEPALVTVSRNSDIDREAQRRRIQAEQHRVGTVLRSLGAIERGRIQQLRNSIAVDLPREQVDAARRIPGVRALRTVRDIDRAPPHPRD